MPEALPIPAPSATLLLLRDGPGGLEVLLMCRSEASGFAPGAYVFPAGRICPDRGALGDGALERATDILVPFAHWITPAPRPKRFDPWFFVAPAPADQVAAHDGYEATDAVWLRPADVLAKAEADTVKMVFATRLNI